MVAPCLVLLAPAPLSLIHSPVNDSMVSTAARNLTVPCWVVAAWQYIVLVCTGKEPSLAGRRLDYAQPQGNSRHVHGRTDHGYGDVVRVIDILDGVRPEDSSGRARSSVSVI